MPAWVLVLVGGALGSVARFAVGTGVAARWPGLFPWPTLAVNLLGSVAIGVAVPWLSAHFLEDPRPRLLLVVGFLGGFTTFSSFAWETYSLLRAGRGELALAYSLGSLTLGVAAVWLGTRLVE